LGLCKKHPHQTRKPNYFCVRVFKSKLSNLPFKKTRQTKEDEKRNLLIFI
jgi:hypothetical protein